MAENDKKKFGPFKIIIIVVVVLLLGLASLILFLDVNQFKPELESRLSDALGRDVKTGKLSLSLLSGAVGVDEITIADDPEFSSAPFLQAKSLKIGVELKPLIFSKELRITEISLDGPSINLIQSSAGRWNFSSIGAGKSVENSGAEIVQVNSSNGISGEDIVVKLLKISDARIAIHRAGKDSKPSVYSDVNITAADLSYASSFPFNLTAVLPGEGSLSLEGKAGPIGRPDLAKTPLEANINVKRFDLIESGFVSPDTGLEGILDFEGVLSSNGLQVVSQGQARADRLRLMTGGSPVNRAVSLEYAVNYDLAQRRGVLENAKMSFGKAVATLKGSFRSQTEGMAVKMRLTGKDMPVDDVEDILPAFGVVLPEGASLEGGVLNTDMTAEGSVDKLAITGSAGIGDTRLVGFDLAGKMAVLAQLAGIKPDPETEIETLSSRMSMTPAGIRVNDIKLVVPAIGALYGDGNINPDQSLDFKMQAQVKASGGIGLALGQLIGGRASDGKMTIPFFIRGTASKPIFVPDLKNAAGGILGSQFSGQSGREEEEKSDTEKILGDALRNLLGE